MQYKHIVKSAGNQLLAHPVGKMPHISSRWNSLEFRCCSDAGTQNTALVHSTANVIVLYPSLLSMAPSKADYEVIRAFGILLVTRATQAVRERWEKKLSAPYLEQIEAVQTKLSDSAFRAGISTYKELVHSFATAVDRLVALNLTNALLANGVPFESSAGIKLKEWGSTADYAGLKKFHSLVPLTSAYAPSAVHACYGSALAELIVNKMGSVRESSTKAAFEKLVVELTRLCR